MLKAAALICVGQLRFFSDGIIIWKNTLTVRKRGEKDEKMAGVSNDYHRSNGA